MTSFNVLTSFTNSYRVGAGAVVVKDVPANSTVVGIPGRIVSQRNGEFKLVLVLPQLSCFI